MRQMGFTVTLQCGLTLLKRPAEAFVPAGCPPLLGDRVCTGCSSEASVKFQRIVNKISSYFIVLLIRLYPSLHVYRVRVEMSNYVNQRTTSQTSSKIGQNNIFLSLKDRRLEFTINLKCPLNHILTFICLQWVHREELKHHQAMWRGLLTGDYATGELLSSSQLSPNQWPMFKYVIQSSDISLFIHVSNMTDSINVVAQMLGNIWTYLTDESSVKEMNYHKLCGISKAKVNLNSKQSVSVFKSWFPFNGSI